MYIFTKTFHPESLKTLYHWRKTKNKANYLNSMKEQHDKPCWKPSSATVQVPPNLLIKALINKSPIGYIQLSEDLHVFLEGELSDFPGTSS